MSDLQKMCEAHFNEPMISGSEIVRCIGYGETAVDCYIITRHIGGKVSWSTCVGGYVFLDRLKGQNRVTSNSGDNWDDLTRLDSLLSLNGCLREAEFITDRRPEEEIT